MLSENCLARYPCACLENEGGVWNLHKYNMCAILSSGEKAKITKLPLKSIHRMFSKEFKLKQYAFIAFFHLKFAPFIINVCTM